MSYLNIDGYPPIRCKSHKNTLFPIVLHIGKCDDVIPNYDEDTLAVTYHIDSDIYMIFRSDISLPIIAHECVHATQFIGKIIAEPLTGEPEAYTVQWCVNKCLEVLNTK